MQWKPAALLAMAGQAFLLVVFDSIGSWLHVRIMAGEATHSSFCGGVALAKTHQAEMLE
jgi:hypothetical protein